MQLTGPLRLILATAALATASGAWSLSSLMGYGDDQQEGVTASASAAASGGLKGRRMEMADEGTDMMTGDSYPIPTEESDEIYADMDVSGLTAAELAGEEDTSETMMMTTMDDSDGMDATANGDSAATIDDPNKFVEDAPPPFDALSDENVDDEFATGIEYDGASPGAEGEDWIAEQEAAMMAEVEAMQKEEEESAAFEEASEDEFDTAQAEAEALAEDNKNAGTTLAESTIATKTDEIVQDTESEAPVLTVSASVTAEVAAAIETVTPDSVGDLPPEAQQALLEETLIESESAEEQDAAEAAAPHDTVPTPDDEPDRTIAESEVGQANVDDVADDSLPGHDAAENEDNEENTEDLGESVLDLGEEEILGVDEGVPDIIADIVASDAPADGDAPPIATTADEVLESIIEAADTEIYVDEIREESAEGLAVDDGTPPPEVMQDFMDDTGFGFYGSDLADSVEETIVDFANGEDELPLDDVEPEGTEADDIPADDVNMGEAEASRRRL